MQQDLPLHRCLLQEDDKFRLLLSRTLNVDGSDGASYFDKVGQAAAACLCQPYVLAKFLQLAPAECVTSAALSPLSNMWWPAAHTGSCSPGPGTPLQTAQL